MGNVYIRINQNGCVIQKDGREDHYTDLRAARQASDDAEVALALLCKSGSLLEDGSLQLQSSYNLSPNQRVHSALFEQRGCQYQVSLFTEKNSSGHDQLTAVQLFPAQSVKTYLDIYISDPQPLQLAGFLASSSVYLKK